MNRHHRNLLAVASAAIAVVMTLSSCAAGTSPGGTPTAPASGATTTPSFTPTTSPTTAHGPACATGDLTASSPEPGDAAGTEIVPILFRNVSTAPCWFGGVPTLFGITADGRVTKLPFHGLSFSWQPQSGPGELAPGKQGIVKVTMQLNNCPYPSAAYQTYRTLRIQFPTGAIVTIPYPKSLAVTGCPAGISEAGLGTQ